MTMMTMWRCDDNDVVMMTIRTMVMTCYDDGDDDDNDVVMMTIITVIMTYYDDDDVGDDDDNNGGCNSLEYMKVLHEPQRGCDHRSLWELLRKRERKAIHLIPKWRPINYSFVCMLISPLRLIFTSKFSCVLHMLTRPRGLINMQTKE